MLPTAQNVVLAIILVLLWIVSVYNKEYYCMELLPIFLDLLAILLRLPVWCTWGQVQGLYSLVK